MDDEPIANVICCQGSPRCMLEGDGAVAAQEAGCIWCTRTTIMPDGSEYTTGPTIA